MVVYMYVSVGSTLSSLCCVSGCWFLSMFFFSSRRRHTRSLCDWSSDVCSSDLVALLERERAEECDLVRELRRQRRDQQRGERSEERRVGKECRSRWPP